MSISDEVKEFLLHRAFVKTVPNSIEIDELFALVSTYNHKHPQDSIEINDLLINSEVVFRTSSAQPPSNESELETLRRRGEERQYQRSIANVSDRGKGAGAATEIKAASESVSFATHFILAFLPSFLVGYYLGEYIFELSESGRYICGGAASFLTLILESVLFIIREEKRAMIPKFRSKKSIKTAPGGSSEVMPISLGSIDSSVRRRA